MAGLQSSSDEVRQQANCCVDGKFFLSMFDLAAATTVLRRDGDVCADDVRIFVRCCSNQVHVRNHVLSW